jgi:pyruvate dehydrogenase kinase 2/3/4
MNSWVINHPGSIFQTHQISTSATVIPNLSLGLSLSSPFLPPEQLDPFMRRMLVSRISRRVLAEHHIALSNSWAGRVTVLSGDPHVGIIFTGLNVKRSIDKCARLLKERRLDIEDHDGEPFRNTTWPDVVIDGHVDTHFAYIREHLEYGSHHSNVYSIVLNPNLIGILFSSS